MMTLNLRPPRVAPKTLCSACVFSHIVRGVRSAGGNHLLRIRVPAARGPVSREGVHRLSRRAPGGLGISRRSRGVNVGVNKDSQPNDGVLFN